MQQVFADMLECRFSGLVDEGEVSLGNLLITYRTNGFSELELNLHYVIDKFQTVLITMQDFEVPTSIFNDAGFKTFIAERCNDLLAIGKQTVDAMGKEFN